MIIDFSMLVSNMSGKVSGGVIVPGKGSARGRKKSRPHQPASNYNAASRARLTSVQAAWAALDIDQVRAWNELAKNVFVSNRFGNKLPISGINLFQRLNNNLLNVGEEIIEDAPVFGDVGLFTTFTPSVVHDGAVSIVFAESPVAVDQAVILQATAPMFAGRQPKPSDFRQIAVIPAEQATPYTATTAYQAKYGSTYAADKYVYFRAYFINLDTGQAGQVVQEVALIS